MAEAPFPATGTLVARGDRIGRADELTPGPGTVLDDGYVCALRDGVFRVHDGAGRVVPPTPTRARRTDKPGDGAISSGRNRGGVGGKSGIHRHGLGKHGRIRGKAKKGFGDQGTWD